MGAQPRPLKAALILSEVISERLGLGEAAGRAWYRGWCHLYYGHSSSGADPTPSATREAAAKQRDKATAPVGRCACLVPPPGPWPLATLFVKQEGPSGR